MHYRRRAQLRIKTAKEKRKQRKKNRLIRNLKAALKKEEEYIEMCKEKGKDINHIDEVSFTFVPLDVSAKTVNGEVYLNEKLLDADWDEQMRYLVHEICHVFQQENGEVNGKANKGDYLDDENEQEAFQSQISFMADYNSPEEIQEYIENLLDHHDIKGKERQEKTEKLTEKID